MHDAGDRRVPVLVVSGFLGSGKTTLVRHLLREAQASGTRVAVISNEFGALGIDQALLGDGGEAFVELEGGCVCCQLSDELRDTLQMLRERVQPDRVIVETSGVALPSDTQLQFWREPVSAWVEDDVAVGRDLRGPFEAQVSSADLLLLNKIDLPPVDDVDRLDALLRDMAPDTPILHASHGQVEPSLLFPPDPDGWRVKRRGSGPGPSQHHHEAFETFEMCVADGVEGEELLARLRGIGMLRAKGFVRTSEGLQLLQGVGRRLELMPPPGLPPDRLVGRVVVIRRAAEKEGNSPR